MKKILLVVLTMALLLTGCGPKKTQVVATDGSTSMEKVMGALGEQFQKMYADTTFTYNPTGSGAGIMAVKEGRCDIGLSSRRLKEAEKEAGLTETILAYDGIALIVHKDNPVKDLTLEQIKQIYIGEITNWKEVGGQDLTIVPIGREAGSGTRDGFESVTGTENQCAYRQELTSTGDVITTVAHNENAIGYASIASIKDTVAMLTIDGVAPNEETITTGRYAVQRPFVLVTQTDKALSKVAQQFYDYVLSEDAKQWLYHAGVIPAKGWENEK